MADEAQVQHSDKPSQETSVAYFSLLLLRVLRRQVETISGFKTRSLKMRGDGAADPDEAIKEEILDIWSERSTHI